MSGAVEPERAWYPPHQPNCLGCGPDNAASLGLKMRPEGEGVGHWIPEDRPAELAALIVEHLGS